MKPKQVKRELKKLYDLIPTFRCIEGCTDCCGPVPTIRPEKEKAPLLAGTATQVEGLVDGKMLAWCATCPYAVAGLGCAVYDNRPFLCRLFGTSEEPMMTCSHGCGSDRKFTKAQTTKLLNRYLELASDEDRLDFLRMRQAWEKKYEQEPELPRDDRGTPQLL